MSQTVEFDPNTAPLEELEAYLSQPADPQQDDAAAEQPVAEESEVEYVDMTEAAPEAPAPAEPVQAEAPVTYSREEYEAALGRRAKEVRESVQRSEEYLLGREFIARRAASDQITHKEAAKRIREEYFAAEAERLSKDPKALAEAVLRAQMPQAPAVEEAPQQVPQAPTHEARAQALAAAVRESMHQGRLPSNFNVEDCLGVYPEFFSDAEQFGEAAAVRIAETKYQLAAAQNAARRVEAQRSAPRPIAPRSQPAPAPRSFESMSDEEFERFDRQIDRHSNAGIHVKI